MTQLDYTLVDVFTDRPFGGNQLAVFAGGQALSTAVMQSIARELNLSETVFVFPPDQGDNDFRLRIFTPAVELQMAGHPTIGTAFVLAREKLPPHADGRTTLKLEEKVGLIPVSIDWKNNAPVFAQMEQPLPRFGPRFNDVESIAEMLSIDPRAILGTNLPLEVVSCGVPFLFVPLDTLQTIRSVRFRREVWERVLCDFAAPHVFVFTLETETESANVHSRMFAPALGIPEDPATGGASGPLGCYLVHHLSKTSERTATFLGEQGFEMGRPSFIYIEIEREGDQITSVRVGGQSYFMGRGSLDLPL